MWCAWCASPRDGKVGAKVVILGTKVARRANTPPFQWHTTMLVHRDNTISHSSCCEQGEPGLLGLSPPPSLAARSVGHACYAQGKFCDKFLSPLTGKGGEVLHTKPLPGGGGHGGGFVHPRKTGNRSGGRWDYGSTSVCSATSHVLATSTSSFRPTVRRQLKAPQPSAHVYRCWPCSGCFSGTPGRSGHRWAPLRTRL